MTKTWNSRLLLVSVLILMLVAVTPVAATYVDVDLGKTYQYKGTNITHIFGLDIGDPSVSKVEILSTGVNYNTPGDGSDVRIIQQPSINTVTRIFDQQSAKFQNVTVTLVGDTTTTISYRSPPTSRYYISPVVPTFKITAPGYWGNPMVVQVNDSIQRAAITRTASPVIATNMTYFYNMSSLGNGILFFNSKGVKQAYGSFVDNAPFDASNIDYTLSNNRVSLDPFVGYATTAVQMGDDYPATKAGTGKYFAGAIRHDEADQTTTVIAGTSMLVLQQETPIIWNDDYGTHSLPMTYVKGEMGNVTLSFPNANAATTPTKIGYVLINSKPQYNIQAHANMTLLAENAEDRWEELMPTSRVIDILYDSIRFDFGAPFTYNITAVGQPNAPDATMYSKIAITPGFGMSDNASASQITILEENFAELNDGVYYLYLMGVNDNNDVVAFSQSEVSIKSGGAVTDPTSPTLLSIMPTSGARNNTISFTLKGQNFPTDFGPSGVNVTLQKIKNTTITTQITSVTSTTVTGTFNPGMAYLGKWDVYLTDNDAGLAILPAAFTITAPQKPTVTGFVPTPLKGVPNTTVSFVVKGTNFETGSDMTRIRFLNAKTGAPLNATNPLVFNVTPTQFDGIMVIPYNAPAGDYKVNVTTVDYSGYATSTATFSVISAKPSVTGFTPTPAKGVPNTSVSFVVKGTNFQTGVNTTWVRFINAKTGAILNATSLPTLYNVTPTQFDGRMFIPANAPLGDYKLNVTTTDGGYATGAFTFTVVSPKAAVTGFTPTPAKGVPNASVSFVVKGTNFQTGVNNTWVRFLNTKTGAVLNATSLPVLYNVTPTQFDGTMFIPYTAPLGDYKLNVSTTDGGYATGAFTFTVGAPKATVTGFIPTPAKGVPNTSVSFVVKGTNFQAGVNNTWVRFLNTKTGAVLNATSLPVLYNVTPGQFDGTMFIPYTAPLGDYKLNVSTTDGGYATGSFTFTVVATKPTVTGLSPAAGFQNTTVSFVVKGTNFQTGVNNTWIRFLNAKTGASLTTGFPALYNITPTQFDGVVIVPADAPIGDYKLNLTTTDGGYATSASTFKVNLRPAPTVATILPSTVSKNNTVIFTINGNNFRTEPGYNNVTLISGYTGAKLFPTITSVTTNKIGATFLVPANAMPGPYTLNVFTVDGGNATKSGAVNVLVMPPPTIQGPLSPTSGYLNRSVNFTIKGNNFQPDGGTFVRLYSTTTDTAIYATIYNVTGKSITGKFVVPANAALGKYRLDVMTEAGGFAILDNAFTVNRLPAPTLAATPITPIKGYKNMTVSFTVTGNNFQIDNTSVKFWNKTGNSVLTPTIFSVSPTQIIGSVSIPTTANASWYLNVTTLDGQTVSKEKAFTAAPLPPPLFKTITPTGAVASSDVPFVITGDYFLPRKGTNVTFQNGADIRPAKINVIYQTRMSGTVNLSGAAPGNWAINITTIDAGKTNWANKFTVF